jgi:predicted PurR-regulated permease PerM
MTDPKPENDDLLQRRVIDAGIRIGFLVLIIAWCVQIVRPFVLVIAWGAILAVATHSSYLRIEKALSGRRRLAATLYILLALALLMVPSLVLTRTFIGGIRTLAAKLNEGTLTVPPPPETIATWPIIGVRLDGLWRDASENITALSDDPAVKQLGSVLLSKAAGAGFALLAFMASIIIAGVLLAHASGGAQLARGIAMRLAGDRGAEYVHLAETTIRSVARGILGVALIQAILAGIGFLAVGLKAAGLWAVIIFLVAVVQLPAILVLGPIAIYVFATASTTTAVLFAVWSVVVGLSDNVLKPLLLGRGAEVPMLIVFIGVVGGFIVDGFIGLFTGAVVLALGYRLFRAWLEGDRPAAEQPSVGAPEALKQPEGTGRT